MFLLLDHLSGRPWPIANGPSTLRAYRSDASPEADEERGDLAGARRAALAFAGRDQRFGLALGDVRRQARGRRRRVPVLRTGVRRRNKRRKLCTLLFDPRHFG